MADFRTWAGAALIGAALAGGTAFAQQAQEPFDAVEREAIEGIIADYILDNPEIIYRAIQILQERQQAVQAEATRLALENNRAALERDPNSPVGGNPEGDVTVVEFFDYRCPYCKRVAPDVERLTAEDDEVRLVYKEWPSRRWQQLPLPASSRGPRRVVVDTTHARATSPFATPPPAPGTGHSARSRSIS